MRIREKILQKILDEPVLFAEILRISNSSASYKLKPETLIRRLQRRSEVVAKDVAIADYFRDKGYTDEEIFEQN